jgi:hypothetical protein
LEENVQAIKRSEKAIRLARSKAEQISDWRTIPHQIAGRADRLRQ